MIRSGAQQGSTQTTARQADASHPSGIDIFAGANIIERDAIFVGDDRCDIGSQQCAIFRDKVFVQIGRTIVADHFRAG